ncbi:MAG: hypothetical protein K2X27_17010 [Candidatus Obscuribacterales bacterium]|nr:hypothetical protein [Candidatus Obscuribacterales bacterium]
MHLGNQRIGFAKLNSCLQSSSPQNCNYVWDEGAVALQNSYFDEASYRQSKLNRLIALDLSLSSYERAELINQVFTANKDLLLAISHALPAEWKRLDCELDGRIHEALQEAEHQIQLRISRQNIAKTQVLEGGWMSAHDLGAIVDLTQKNRFNAAGPSRFVTRNRH